MKAELVMCRNEELTFGTTVKNESEDRPTTGNKCEHYVYQQSHILHL